MISMNIKYLRTKSGMTQEAFAEKLDVTRQTVAKWESGESLPDIRKCADMSAIFEVSLDAMVTMPLDEQMETEDYKDGKNVFGIVKVGERGQVVIPKVARQFYDIKAGDKLLVVGDKRGMALAKIRSFSDFSFGG
ncbi:MAG: helix-turn-helix transcriptional regulator [Ruminococcus sp.]|nr:helix-turn-helix transcriptional regulator [Oscillospiraceae bacterium]MBR2724920.1 helix-turn-helix transcriptional regulator [Ruminococcus sp.]